MQREATRSKNFGGSGQRSRSFTGHRKNMPKISNTAVSAEGSVRLQLKRRVSQQCRRIKNRLLRRQKASRRQSRKSQ